MPRHPFDPVSAALGILAVAAGVAVMLTVSADVEGGAAWWLTAATVLVGLAIIPWRRPRKPG